MSVLQFVLNNDPIRISDLSAEKTLLDFLRLDRQLCGTKEGCAEGDCGACTVIIGEAMEGEIRYRPVNSCIRPLATVHGQHVVTIENLDSTGTPSPLQKAMTEGHASQCGFCTPGIVMSLTVHLSGKVGSAQCYLETAMDGNLCRCTGYRPIIDAAKAAAIETADALPTRDKALIGQLSEISAPESITFGVGESVAIRPASIADLLDHLTATPNARLVAGATDVGLWVTKDLQNISPAIFIDHLPELRGIKEEDGTLNIGACVTYAMAEQRMLSRFPHLTEYWRRFAGPQIRATGTIGGNIANGSPIGDMPPALIALDSSITLRSKQERRMIRLEEFFIDYGKQDLRQGEFLECIRIPAQPQNALHAAYKLSKRKREDISAVAMGARIVVDAGIIADARIAFGGMAATPKRAKTAEQILTGATWSKASFDKAAEALGEDFTPLTDWRASAGYRLQAAGNMLRRFWLEKGAGA